MRVHFIAIGGVVVHNPAIVFTIREKWFSALYSGTLEQTKEAYVYLNPLPYTFL